MILSCKTASVLQVREKILKNVGDEMGMDPAEIFENRKHFIEAECSEKCRLNAAETCDDIEAVR